MRPTFWQGILDWWARLPFGTLVLIWATLIILAGLFCILGACTA